MGKDYLACSAARKLGSCPQKRSFRRTTLEEFVLGLVREKLMQPDAVALFVEAYGREMNAGRAEETGRRTRLEAERAQAKRRLDGLYDAIADGLRTPGLKGKLEELEARIAEFDRALAAPAPTAVRLHPNLSEAYRRKVSELSALLRDPETAVPALEAIRGLIERVSVHETTEGVRIELEGAITALIGLAQGGTAKSPLESGLDVGSVKVVAGAGFEPAAFRL
ncbi:MAG: hypothetical protein U5N10_13855 [Gemmobacter sp.]|nr:hypothetical protein [Gemmobacter sp.]